jgi:hypothetical protein
MRGEARENGLRKGEKVQGRGKEAKDRERG